MQTVSFFIRFSWFKELMRIPEKNTFDAFVVSIFKQSVQVLEEVIGGSES